MAGTRADIDKPRRRGAGNQRVDEIKRRPTAQSK